MREITLEELLEAGCHFGHQVTRHNPKSRDFVFEARDNIHIIDLAKTKEGLEEAGRFVSNLAKRNGVLVVVGTKRQAHGIVAEDMKKAADAGADGIYYVTDRWIGGILTNFPEVSKNFKKLRDLTQRLQSEEEKSKYTKKEIGLWEKERGHLQSLYGGIAEMKQVPDALYIIDTHSEDLAVKEANKTGIKTVGIVDTNADPAVINHPIPANDDAVGSIKFITNYIVDAWIEGRNEAKKQVFDREAQTESAEEKPAEAKSAETKPTEEKKPKKAKVAKKAKTEENKEGATNGKRKPRASKKTA